MARKPAIYADLIKELKTLNQVEQTKLVAVFTAILKVSKGGRSEDLVSEDRAKASEQTKKDTDRAKPLQS